jgi:hypothetical protein
MSNHPRHWTARRSKRRVAPYWEVRNTRGVMAVVYGKQADAELMAAAPRLLTALTALVRAKPGTQAHDAAHKAAMALVDELS